MGRGDSNIIPERSACQEIPSVYSPMYFLKGAMENFGVSPDSCQCYCNYCTGKMKMGGAKEAGISWGSSFSWWSREFVAHMAFIQACSSPKLYYHEAVGFGKKTFEETML